jgi:hypothetical protein
MQLSVRPYVTIGIAVVGASVIVATPAVAPPPEVTRPVQIAAAQALPDQNLGGFLSNLESTIASLLPSSTGAPGTVGGGSSTSGEALLSVLEREISNITTVLEAAPGNLTTLLNDVIQNPTELPNALSTVADLLFQLPQAGNITSPMVAGLVAAIGTLAPRSLLGAVLLPIVTTLEENLPAPLGGGALAGSPGLVATVYDGLASLVDGALGLLPKPLPLSSTFNTTTVAATAAVVPDTAKSLSLTADTTTVSDVPALTVTRTPRVVKMLVTTNAGVNNATSSSLTGQNVTGGSTTKHTAKAPANERIFGAARHHAR